MFETFDHTADLGLRATASTYNELFVQAGHGLTSMLVDNPDSIRAISETTLRIESGDREYLLFDWLSELLLRYEVDGLLFAEFSVEADFTSLTATVRGESVDPDRHEIAHEVKAITYHGLMVEQTASGWLAEVIVDI